MTITLASILNIFWEEGESKQRQQTWAWVYIACHRLHHNTIAKLSTVCWWWICTVTCAFLKSSATALRARSPIGPGSPVPINYESKKNKNKTKRTK